MGLSIQYGFGRVRFARLFPHRRRQHWLFPREEGRSCLDRFRLCLEKGESHEFKTRDHIYSIQLYNNSLTFVKIVNELFFSFHKNKN